MTVTPSNSTPQPGWYLASDGSGRQQWWDGQSWTGNFHPNYLTAPVKVRRPRLGDATPVYNPFIWLVTLLPVVQLLLLLAWHPLPQYRLQGPSLSQAVDPTSIFTPAYFLALASGWVIYAACAVLAFLDWRRLRHDGVVQPFHWAWVFLNMSVYVIGRSVIVHQVAPKRGLAPIWVHIGVLIFSCAVISIKMAALFSIIAQSVRS